MNRTTDNKTTIVNLWQQNLNKSATAQQDLINSTDPKIYDILALQEPYIDFLGNTRTNHNWYPLLPTAHCNNPRKTHAAAFINKHLQSSSWQQNKVNSQDVVSISINTSAGIIAIFNIYNDCDHSRSLHAIWNTLAEDAQSSQLIDLNKMVWLGDFNWHHPLWDEECNVHLFTTTNLDAAQILLDLLAEHDMMMTLLKNTPTLCASHHKEPNTPRQCFLQRQHLRSHNKMHDIPRPPAPMYIPLFNIQHSRHLNAPKFRPLKVKLATSQLE